MKKGFEVYKKPCTACETFTFNQDVHLVGMWQCPSSSLSKSWSEEKIWFCQNLSPCREEEEGEGGNPGNSKYDTHRIGGV